MTTDEVLAARDVVRQVFVDDSPAAMKSQERLDGFSLDTALGETARYGRLGTAAEGARIQPEQAFAELLELGQIVKALELGTEGFDVQHPIRPESGFLRNCGPEG
ncbi:MAG: hypothetical protein HC794_06980, partial [Nitrospiraceae bacterium]|nr:hypothetical protein [Nitrospiraceae bacterium]